jgi:hypothetical protein
VTHIGRSQCIRWRPGGRVRSPTAHLVESGKGLRPVLSARSARALMQRSIVSRELTNAFRGDGAPALAHPDQSLAHRAQTSSRSAPQFQGRRSWSRIHDGITRAVAA